MHHPIAIVGIGGIFPGAMNVAQFWEHVLAGRSLAREVPPGRWPLSREQAFDPRTSPPQPDKVYSTRACFVDPFTCDLDGLSISREQLDRLDPMFHLLLHAGRAAWCDTVTKNADPKRTGIIIGNIALPTDASSNFTDEILTPLFEAKLFAAANAPSNRKSKIENRKSTDPHNRYVAGLPAAILARALGLTGTAFTLDAACASSLYALKLAADELLAGRADLMLTGGLSRPDCLYTQMGFSQLHALSPSGRCAPFDARADGLVVGEGSGILALKHLDDALRDGDHIYATIAGIGLSNDIAGNLMQPDSSGQLRAMRAAYQNAGWSPADIDHIECHGTGTPVGDAVELNSLSQLWQKSGADALVGRGARPRCVIGSVKSNVGHLLTAAGSAGLIKTLLAMRDGKLPPTANFASPAAGVALGKGPFEVLRETSDWPRPKQHRRRAAVSAFGFGGINAHVLLEQWENTPVPRPSGGERATDPSITVVSETSRKQVAIVGLAARFGSWESTEAVKNRFFGHDATQPTQPRRWWGSSDAQDAKGYFIDDVSVPLGRFRIPPAELSEMLPQQLLMLQAAGDAFEDAGWTDHPGDRLDTGVFIGIELDLNTTNFRFRWTMPEKARAWARQMGLKLSDEQLDQWVAQLRTAAGPALNANRTMGALGGIVASRVARAFRVGGPSFTISSEETSPLHALHVAVSTLQRGDISVALVGAVDLAGDLRSGADALVGSSTNRAAILGEGAAALILKRHEDALRDGDRIYALLDDASDNTSAVAIDTPELGHAGVASALASVVKAALALHHETLPDNPPRYWLHNRAAGPRRAVVRTTSIAGAKAHVTLQSAGTHVPTPATPLPERLFTFSARTQAELLPQLAELASLAKATTELATLAHAWFKAHPQTDGPVKLALVANSTAHLRDLLNQCQQALANNLPIDSDDAFFNPAATPKGQIAFVYPGSGTHFETMGHDLSAQFPHILHQQYLETQHLASQFGEPPHPYLETGNSKLEPARDAIFAQVSLGCFVTDLLATFALKPHAVIGYSLGESTSLFATRTWRDHDGMLARMQASTLFTTDLAGPCHAARQAWKLAENEQVDWLIGVINRPADVVRPALANRNRVYLLIINTPHECVIGGQRQAVEQLVAALRAKLHKVSDVTTVHCEVAHQVAAAYRDLHVFDTTPPKDVRFYSTSAGTAYTPTPEATANSILGQALAPFDFTRLIRNAYADGVRYFIEVGPGSSCCRMIDQILAGQPHLARPICVAGQNNVGTLLRTLAHLFTEGLPLDLSPLYADAVEEKAVDAQATRYITVQTGGDEFQVPPPPQTPPATSTKMPREKTPSLNPSPSLTHIPTPTPALSLTPEPMRAKLAEATSPTLHLLLAQATATQIAHARAQESFLRLAQANLHSMSQAIAFQQSLLQNADTALLDAPLSLTSYDVSHPIENQKPNIKNPVLDRAQCFEFAIGKIANVLGPAFAHIDAYPTRVRLPDEPLQLVDRITLIEGTPNALLHNADAGASGGGGRCITEHDIHENAWYLDANRTPTCIAVEAGQADLFLSGYLGIDSITKGLAVYRLLDAVVTFHAPLPTPGHTIVYDIRIEEFFRQGDTHLFRFHFDATVNGTRFLTMTKGCAGFFTEAELAAGQGIVQTSLDTRPDPRKLPEDWLPLAFTPGQPSPWERESPDSPSTKSQPESYSDTQLNALREGDLEACFGPRFASLQSKIENQKSKISYLPSARMTLVHRILSLNPTAGKYSLGQITGEADIHPNDWFLTCHFVDDRVMPGTLMYECCLHTLRVYLLRMGWVGIETPIAYEPIPGIASQLKCRGQVTAATKKVQYEVTLKELGYEADGTPYAIADALMYADGKPIVQMLNMSTRLTGLTKNQVAAVWQNPPDSVLSPHPSVLFDTPRITAFAIGKPSEAFGEPYKIFDPGQPRKIARLPGPPFQFLDRITRIENAEPFKLKAGAIVEAQYDVPKDAWYFAPAPSTMSPCHPIPLSGLMPFSVLLEIALQPCGWLAAYLGSALTSSTDLKFRNLGGSATQFRPVTPDIGTLTTTVKMTNVSNSGGMIIQHFDMAVRCSEGGGGDVYKGTTYFGFFSKDALANQVGIREATLYQPTPEEIARAQSFPYPDRAPFPSRQMRMVDHITHFDPRGGPKNLGFIRGTATVNPDAWFFKAHFFEDPVWPGSLGIESFIQLLKLGWHASAGAAQTRIDNSGVPAPAEACSLPPNTTFHTHSPQKHSWIYRGQIIPTDKLVTIEATITHRDPSQNLLRAEGHLSVDGRTIYHLKDFTLTMTPS